MSLLLGAFYYPFFSLGLEQRCCPLIITATLFLADHSTWPSHQDRLLVFSEELCRYNPDILCITVLSRSQYFFFQGILQDPTLLEMFLFFPIILLEIPFSKDACHHRKKSSHDKSAKLNWGAIPIKIKKQEIFLLPLDVIVLSLLSLENSKFHKTPPIYSPSCTIP